MLDHLDSYALSDFLLFSQETYLRLFELYNRDIWPLHVVALAASIGLMWLLWRRPAHAGRLIAAVLTIMWAWIGWAFHLERYATINIAASYFAALFAVVAVMLFGIGVLADRLRIADTGTTGARTGIGLVVFAILIDPLIGLADGRAWTELSIFGLGPDPTAIATIGVLLAAEGRLRWLTAVPVVIWCLIAVLTAVAMDSLELIGPALAVGILGLVALHEGSRKRMIRRTVGSSQGNDQRK